jgi:L-fuconolactonase
MIIDAHQHFWNYDPSRHGWIDDRMSAIRRDFLPAELQTIYSKNNIDGCVAVQVDQTEKENAYFLNFAQQFNFIKGIVGWVDLRAGNIEERVEYYRHFPLMKGFRHIVQGESDPDFMLRDDFCRGISWLGRYNFTYDILVYHHQLSQVAGFVKKFPEQSFIIDHLAKPAIAKGETGQWRKNIHAIAKHQQVYCKVSGLVTEANWQTWTYADLEPYLDTVLEAFGPSRLVYGSDWPVCLVAASYEKQLDVINTMISKLSKSERESILGENAIRFYHL